MSSLSFATIAELKEKLKNKETSPEVLANFFIKRFEDHDKELGSALEIFSVDSILNDQKEGTLSGIPGLIKDNICQKSRTVSCASKILKNYTATYDATVISKLKSEGALLLGRANMDEFAMGSSTETSAFQKTRNPWDTERVPGGSSGGSAAAVAAGLVPWALGTSTGGSVRQPAAFCGVVGSKPTYGRVSRSGLVAYGSSLDQVAPITRTVYDNALVLSALIGNDPHDSSSLDVPKTDYTQSLNGQIKEGLKIGVVENMLYAQGMENEVTKLLENTVARYKELGVGIEYVTIPSFDYAAAVYFILSRAEAASNLARFDGVRYGYRSEKSDTLQDMYFNTRYEGFGKEVRRRILIGNYVLSAGHAAEFYGNAQKVRALMHHELRNVFEKVDLLLMPVQAAPAFKFGAFEKNTLQMDLQDYFTAPANITGAPALSLPCGFTEQKLPIGFQLMGPHLSEELLFQTAYAYEQTTPWHKMHPEGF
jgi:aspartyl-tRNA(Asn)/glutamyl-tRNA(Gln) amidotransferase subunit A